MAQKNYVIIFEKFKNSVERIKSNVEYFKDNHQMANATISKLIESLPNPFNTFLGIIWDGIQKDKHSAQEILKILKRIENNNEFVFIHIENKIDGLINNNASHDDIMDVARQIKNSNRKIVSILDSKIDEILQISKETREIGHKTRKDVKKLRSELKWDKDSFKKNFKRQLKIVVKNLKTKNHSDYVFGSVNDLIDDVIKLFKERIEKWDVASVKFATKELFDSLYKFSEAEMSAELYLVFKDLFSYAYSQRKHLIGIMITEIDFIMFESWEDSNNERLEKAAKILLRLGIDFINKDLDITENCAIAIDNISSDMSEPKILAQQILLAACIFERSKNSISNELVENMIYNIKQNCRLNNHRGARDYLKDGIKYAVSEKQVYGINLRSFKQKLLHATINC